MDAGYIIGGLFLTAFVYLIFPIIYVANNGKVNRKKGKKLALSNTFVCALIFFLITLIIVSTKKDETGSEISGYSLAPAFFYYFIAKSIFTDKSLPDDDDMDKKETDTDDDSPTDETVDEDYIFENIKDEEGLSDTDNE